MHRTLTLKGYLGDDHPRVWPISTGKAVKMRFEDSVRFVFDSGEIGTRIWESQIPENGILYLGKYKQPYSIGMFHELRCLSHLRTEMILAKVLRQNNETYSPTRLSRHCLNYLRQMALCRADVDLEPISILPSGAHAYEYRCNDWTSVYDAVSKNQREYMKGELRSNTVGCLLQCSTVDYHKINRLRFRSTHRLVVGFGYFL